MKRNGTKLRANETSGGQVPTSGGSAPRLRGQERKEPDVRAPVSRNACPGVVRGSSSTFARIDVLAISSLSSESLVRYRAYKQALLEREQDDQAVACTLSIFVWDLLGRRSVHRIH